jgi:inner membrane protein
MSPDQVWFWFWVVLSAILLVGEMFTAGFFLLPFSIGAAVAAGATWFGFGLATQWSLFILISVPILLITKRFADRMTVGADPHVAADRAVGRVGLVLETIRPHGVAGRVRVGSEEWRAQCDGSGEVPQGSEVDVLRVEGTHLIVRPRGVPGPGAGKGGAS